LTILSTPTTALREVGDPVAEVVVGVIRLADRSDHLLAGGAGNWSLKFGTKSNVSGIFSKSPTKTAISLKTDF
jgi:hypothetical protein